MPGASRPPERLIPEYDVNDYRILLCKPDHRRLSGVLDAMKANRRPLSPHLRRLEAELRAAEVVDSAEGRSIGIGGSASLRDEDSGEEFTVRLVFPAELDGTSATASVVSPLGVALLGERVGASVLCDSPSGSRRFTILAIVA